MKLLGISALYIQPGSSANLAGMLTFAGDMRRDFPVLFLRTKV
jgi:hypothetical protein